MTAEGAGRVAPGCRQRNSHTSRISASTISGGRMRARRSAARAWLSAFGHVRFVTNSGSTSAARVGSGATPVGVLRAAIGIGSFSPSLKIWRRPAASDLDALDRQALQVGRRILGIEHLAVEEGLFAARGRDWNLVGLDAEVLGGFAPKVFAVDLLDQRLDIDVG